MPVKYFTFVRLIKKTGKEVDNLRRHLDKFGHCLGYFIVRELSPDQTLHCHAVVAVPDNQDFSFQDYVDTHHLKNYIDRTKELPTADLQRFCCYMCKDLNGRSQLYTDYLYNGGTDIIKFAKIELSKKLVLNVDPKTIPVDDPFAINI